MSALIRMTSRNALRYNPALFSRTIKTSRKKEDTVASVAQPPVTVEDFAKPNPNNWVSYGFDHKSKDEDRKVLSLTMFAAVTLCLVVGSFVWAYNPDTQKRDWAQREAYLELRRREKAGLELISPNYIDPAKMVLPSDEELGNTEIII